MGQKTILTIEYVKNKIRTVNCQCGECFFRVLNPDSAFLTQIRTHGLYKDIILCIRWVYNIQRWIRILPLYVLDTIFTDNLFIFVTMVADPDPGLNIISNPDHFFKNICGPGFQKYRWTRFSKYCRILFSKFCRIRSEHQDLIFL